MEREKYEEAFSSDVGIQEFYKLFKYVSSKSAKVLLPGTIFDTILKSPSSSIQLL